MTLPQDGKDYSPFGGEFFPAWYVSVIIIECDSGKTSFRARPFPA
jgi:hypothetical protein